MSRNYVELMKINSNYARNMNRLSNRIFGEPVRPTTAQSMKVVKIFSELPVYKNPEIVDYYPNHPKICNLMKALRDYGLFRDEHEDFKEEFERLRVLRGKPSYKPKKRDRQKEEK